MDLGEDAVKLQSKVYLMLFWLDDWYNMGIVSNTEGGCCNGSNKNFGEN